MIVFTGDPNSDDHDPLCIATDTFAITITVVISITITITLNNKILMSICKNYKLYMFGMHKPRRFIIKCKPKQKHGYKKIINKYIIMIYDDDIMFICTQIRSCPLRSFGKKIIK